MFRFSYKTQWFFGFFMFNIKKHQNRTGTPAKHSTWRKKRVPKQNYIEKRSADFRNSLLSRTRVDKKCEPLREYLIIRGNAVPINPSAAHWSGFGVESASAWIPRGALVAGPRAARRTHGPRAPGGPTPPQGGPLRAPCAFGALEVPPAPPGGLCYGGGASDSHA